jgi:hypothetical protein
LADPRSVDSIAEAIKRVWVDADLRADLVRRGQRRLALFTRDDYTRRLNEILDRAAELVVGAEQKSAV